MGNTITVLLYVKGVTNAIEIKCSSQPLEQNQEEISAIYCKNLNHHPTSFLSANFVKKLQ